MLDYPTVQIYILPLLPMTFALHYTGEYMYMLYHKSRETIEKGDFGPLAELHSAISGLKSLCTMLAADGIETCRHAMDGHGFGGSSGLVGLNSDYLSRTHHRSRRLCSYSSDCCISGQNNEPGDKGA